MIEGEVWVTEHAKEQILKKEKEKEKEEEEEEKGVEFATLLIGVVL